MNTVINININSRQFPHHGESFGDRAFDVEPWELMEGYVSTREYQERARKKGKKKRKAKKCSKGQVCGMGCISKLKTCTNDMSTAEFMAHNKAKREAKRAARQAAKGGGASGAVGPSSEVKTYQEAIERGKAIANDFDKTLNTPKIKKLNDEITLIQSELDQGLSEQNRIVRKINTLTPIMLATPPGSTASKRVQALTDELSLMQLKRQETKNKLDRLTTEIGEQSGYGDFMAKIKSMSGVDDATAKSMADKINFDNSISKPRQVDGKKYKHDIGEIRATTQEFFMLTGDKTSVERVFQDMTNDGKRAYAMGTAIGNKENVVNIGVPGRGRIDTKQTLFHELTHHIEYENPQKADIALDWVKSRASQSTPVPLRNLTGNSEYGRQEVAYPDKFVDPYVGKSNEGRGRNTTEVLTMGFQNFASPDKLIQLYNGDKEHFYLTLGLIAG